MKNAGLISLGASRSRNEDVTFNRTYSDFCKAQVIGGQNSEKSLTLYWSARSPYSYIALQRAIKLSSFYRIHLDIKPVLPMLMRGFNVPKMKKMYIFLILSAKPKSWVCLMALLLIL